MSVLNDIYSSFRRLTAFTQAWMLLFLGPMIFAPLFVLDGPLGIWPAVLSIAGFAPSPFLIVKERGFSGRLSVAHVIFWPILLGLYANQLATQGVNTVQLPAVYTLNAIALGISLIFDVNEVKNVLSGNTKPA